MHDNSNSEVADIFVHEMASASPAIVEPVSDVEGEGEFPITAFSSEFSDMVNMVSESSQTPRTLGALSAIGAVSASLGKGIALETRTRRLTYGNTLIIGEASSGSGKSEGQRPFIEPLHFIQAEQKQKHRTEIKPKLMVELERLQQRSGKGSSGDQADDAIRADELRRKEEIEGLLSSPQYISDDATSQKLTSLMSSNGGMISSITAEARAAFKNLLGRNSRTGRETDEMPLLSGYSVEPITVNRLSRPDLYIERPWVSLLWLIQPDLFRQLIESESLTEGGLFPRCLVARTHAKRMPLTGTEKEFDVQIAARYSRKVESIFRAYRLSVAPSPLIVQPDRDAKAEMIEFHNSTISDAYADISSYVARWTENAWRLSLVLHAMEHGADAHRHTLSADIAARAIAVQKFFAQQQMEFLSSGREVKREERRNKVLRVIAEQYVKLQAPVPKRKIEQYAHLDRDAAAALLAELKANNEVEESTIRPASGPSYKAYAPRSR